jgi:hypothetical protein
MPEHRHQGVAQELVHRAALATDHAVEQLRAPGEMVVGGLGAQQLRESREAHQVGEEHGGPHPLGPRACAGVLRGMRLHPCSAGDVRQGSASL